MMDKKFSKTFHNVIQKRYLKDNGLFNHFPYALSFNDCVAIETAFLKAQTAIAIDLLKDIGIYDDIRIKMLPYFMQCGVNNIFDYIVTIEKGDVSRAVNIILGYAKYKAKERNNVMMRLTEQIDKFNDLHYLDDIIK